MTRERVVGATILITMAVALTGCAGGLAETGEPLTVAQSERLAQARFQLSTEGEFAVHVVSGEDDDLDRVAADLTVDPADTAAWGTLTRGPEGIAVSEDVILAAGGYAVDSGSGWVTQSWSSGDASFLGVVLSLTADRPENAQLLRQSDAAYLGVQDGLEVYRLPAEEAGADAVTRLWLDEDGRLEKLDTTTGAFTVDIDRDADVSARPDEVDELLEGADE